MPFIPLPRGVHAEPFQRARDYLADRTVETLGLLYAMHWPYRQPESARGARRSAVHDRLAARGACFGVAMGWERPMWFSGGDRESHYEYGWGETPWFRHWAAEHPPPEHRAAEQLVALLVEQVRRGQQRHLGTRRRQRRQRGYDMGKRVLKPASVKAKVRPPTCSTRSPTV